MSETLPPKVAVVDIDGTLVSGNCNMLMGKKLARGLAGLRAVAKAIGLGLTAASNPNIVTEMMSLSSSFFAGKTENEMTADLRRVFESEIRPRIIRPMAERIREHKRHGAQVWLSAPVPQHLADLLAKETGADRALGLILRVDSRGRLTGEVEGAAPYRIGKRDVVLRELSAAGISPSETVFYSDAISDLPLLEAVGKPVCVNPQRPLLEEARRRGWPVEHWR